MKGQWGRPIFWLNLECFDSPPPPFTCANLWSNFKNFPNVCQITRYKGQVGLTFQKCPIVNHMSNDN